MSDTLARLSLALADKYRIERELGAALLLLVAACAAGTPAPPTPTNITAVEQTSGTTSLLIGLSPVNENVVWASGVRGTWVRTIDGGATWTHGVVPGAELLQFRDVHALDASTAWLMSAGTSDSARIYVTHDGGAHWILQYANPDVKGFYDCMDFWDARRGLVVGDAVDGQKVILSTADGGAHWGRIYPPTLPPADSGEGSFAASGTCLITRHGGHAWIAVGTPTAKLLHTADYGRTWTSTAIPLVAISSVAFRDDHNGIVLGTDSSAATASTSDGGQTWVRGGKPPFGQGVYGGIYVQGTKHPTVVAVGPGGLAWSRDDGASWTVINNNVYWTAGSAPAARGRAPLGAVWAMGARGRITKLSGF
jgi:photosystem II stability/assembly factor-like uncharacterized protein